MIQTRYDQLWHRWLTYLVGWFACFQLGHLIVLLVFLTDPIRYTKLFQPPEGWTTQGIDFLIGWSVADASLAVISLLAVLSWFRDAKHAALLLFVIINLTFYSALLFLSINIRLGTFANSPLLSALATLGYLPVLFLGYGLFQHTRTSEVQQCNFRV